MAILGVRLPSIIVKFVEATPQHYEEEVYYDVSMNEYDL